MNRKQKIIVSVTGIFLILLILMGLTYAYFLTQIKGNSNSTSISVTTANLIIEYDDMNNILQPTEKMRPNKLVGTKSFSITNRGDSKVDNYLLHFENVNNTLVRPEDLVYTVTCKSYLTTDYEVHKDSATENGSCNGVSNETQLPSGTGSGTGSILMNSIDVGFTHVYVLTLKYLEAGVDQSADMNKTISAKINITDPRGFNPYRGNEESLAYSILNNSYDLAYVSSNSDVRLLGNELLADSSVIATGLPISPDNYGVSYYFKGLVKNNYVEFGGMCFRVVRIQGDGSVKMTLAKQGLCSTITSSDTASGVLGLADIGQGIEYGTVENSSIADYNNSRNSETAQKYVLENWFNEKLSHLSKYLKTESVCIVDRTVSYDLDGNVAPNGVDEIDEWTGMNMGTYYYYDVYKRLEIDREASLLCSNTSEKTKPSKVYPLTADELFISSGNIHITDSYIYENAMPNNEWWTSSISYRLDATNSMFPGPIEDYPYAFHTGSAGLGSMYIQGNTDTAANFYTHTRPAITLVPNIKIQNKSAKGTQTDPYKIVLN